MSAMLPVSLSMPAEPGYITLLGALAVTLLVILIVVREALRVYNQSFARLARALDIAVYPLLFIFALVVLDSFYRLIFL